MPRVFSLSRMRWAEARWAYLFLLPNLALFLIFTIYPVFASFYYSLNNWTLTLRRGLAHDGKGAAQLDFSRPTGFSPHLRWYVQYFDGYAESLLDFQTRIRRIGVGVMLNDWF